MYRWILILCAWSAVARAQPSTNQAAAAAATNAPPAAMEEPAGTVGSAAGVPAIPVGYPQIPPWEKSIVGISREMFPGIGVWAPELYAGVRSFATTESVGDGLGLRIVVPFTAVGRVVFDQTAVVRNEARDDYQDFKGVSFWVKGDGSSAMGLVGFGTGMEYHHEFPLANKGWQKKFVEWREFDPPLRGQNVKYLNFGIALPKTILDYFWVRRISTYKKKDVDEVVYRYDGRENPSRKVVPLRPIYLHYDELEVEDSDGIQFDVQGSGGVALGQVGWSWSKDKPYEFTIDEEGFTTIRIPWRDLPPPLEVEHTKRYLSIRINRSVNREHHMTVDRIHYFRDKQIEQIRPTDAEDKPGELDASIWAVRPEGLATLRAKMRAKKPVTLVFLGDELMQGAGLFYTFRNELLPFTRTYWSLFSIDLMKLFNYSDLSLAYEIYRVSDNKWHIVTAPTAARRPVNVIALGTNGTTSEFYPKQLDKVQAFNPDLVIFQAGLNDAMFGSAERYRSSLEKLVRGCIERDLPLIIGAPPPVADAYPHSWLEGDTYWRKSVFIAEECRQVADRYQLPFLDTHNAFYARGVHCLGDLYSSHTQPNRLGHRTLADLYLAFFSETALHVWDHVKMPQND